MRIAYFSPLNPVRSGISDYSEDLLPALADLVEVDLFIDDFEPSNQSLVERLALHPIDEYPRRRWDYDMALYHIGNNLYHEAIYRMALRYPGIAILHDYALVGIISSMTLARGDRGGFVREWGYNYGPASLFQVYEILAGHAPLPPDEPLNRRLLDLSLGLIVHSDHLRSRVVQTCPRANVAHVPMPCVSHQRQALTPQVARRELGLATDTTTAVDLGRYWLLAAGVNEMLAVWREALADQGELIAVIAGGDAERLADLVAPEVETRVETGLVLGGIARLAKARR